MSTILSAPAAAQDLVGQSPAVSMVSVLKRWWKVYLMWRIEQAAIFHLSAMSDRELKDIGLIRSEIEPAVRGLPGERPFMRFC